MAADDTAPTITTNQVSTSDLTPPPDASTEPAPPTQPAGTAAPAEQASDRLYSPDGPQPAGTLPGAAEEMELEQEKAAAEPERAPGIEGEEVVWEARYAMKNFLGRITVRMLLTFAWIALAIFTWGSPHPIPLQVVTIALGAVLLWYWLALIYRIVYARFGHYYRLTTRRLFVSTGLMHRRRDQLELLRVKDVYTRQSLTERWLKLGTVVIVPDDQQLPTCYLTGVHDPKSVMDLIWHYSRAQREGKAVEIDQV